MRLSIVVPCFSDEATLPGLRRRSTRAAEDIVGQDFKLVLVNDGSREVMATDAAREGLRALAAQ
jgi:hypothetical protein